MRLKLFVAAVCITLACADGSAAQIRGVVLVDGTKSAKPLKTSGTPGVSISCNILQDDSLEIVGSNVNSKSFECDITCDLKNTDQTSSRFNCTPVLPANASNASLCRATGSFAKVVSGKYSCK